MPNIPTRHAKNSGMQDPNLVRHAGHTIWRQIDSDALRFCDLELDVDDVAEILLRAARLGNSDAQNWLAILGIKEALDQPEAGTY